MKFSNYLKDKIIYISLLIFGIISSEILLLSAKINIIIRIYVGIAPIILYLIAFFVEYYKKRKYYEQTKEKLEELDQKYLLPEVIENANFSEGKILKEIIQETEKSMLEHVNEYKHIQEEYKEYIELWIHEIKIPIAICIINDGCSFKFRRAFTINNSYSSYYRCNLWCIFYCNISWK